MTVFTKRTVDRTGCLARKKKKKNIKWTEKITDLWISLKGQFKQGYWRAPTRGLSMWNSSNSELLLDEWEAFFFVRNVTSGKTVIQSTDQKMFWLQQKKIIIIKIFFFQYCMYLNLNIYYFHLSKDIDISWYCIERSHFTAFTLRNFQDNNFLN